MNKKICKFVSSVLVLIMILMIPATVQAASPGLSKSQYLRCYSRSGSIPVYTSSTLRTRGTSSPYRAYSASAYSSDEIYVYSWNSTWSYISYPVGKTRRYGYIKTSTITPNNYSVSKLTSQARITTYRKATGSTSAGYIAKGDSVWTIGYESGRYQVIYPSGTLYRMAWISSSAYNSYIKKNSPASSGPSFLSRPFSDGYYAFVSGNSSSRILDIHNYEMHDGANVELYQKNLTVNQAFYMSYVGNGYYRISALHSGKVLDVAGGSRSSGTNVQTYTWNGTDAQLWRFASAGNGYYYIQNKLGCYLDNSNGSTNLANNIIVYSYNGSAAQKWKPIGLNLPSGGTKYVKTTSGLKLRSAASTSASSLVTMPYGSSVKEYFSLNGWSYVSYNGKTGYASSSYLSKTKPSSGGTSGASGNTNSGFVINGVNIGYAAGSYFTDNGKACTDHGTKGIHSYTNEKACNCICTYNGKSLGAVQCFGFARYVQSKLYGVNSYNSPGSFYKMSGAYVSAGSLTASKLKTIITSAKVGAHIRTNGSAHSMIITNITDKGFSIIQCNGSNNNEYSGYSACRIGTCTYTWSSYVSSTYGKRGISYIEMKK